MDMMTAVNARSSRYSERRLVVQMNGRLSMMLLLVLLMLLSLQCCVRPTASAATAAAAVVVADVSINRNDTRDAAHCVVVVEDAQVLKEIGSVWVASENPCAIHACEADETGRPHETINKKDCGQFYCEVDSELLPLEGTCCGVCTRTKCLFNETIYEVGQTWHNNNDCTMLECTRLPGTSQPIINAYQKTCPPLPKDCSKEDVIDVDCCPHCLSPNSRAAIIDNDEPKEIWIEEYYRNHPCARECRLDAPPMICNYTFEVEWYETLSKACYDCPRNVTDCQRPHCIVGDGIRRSITVVNRMMPGPSIEVCQNDLLVVDVKNHLMGESTTIHWHGMHQHETPYMDGVPHITQCPISPHSTFRYTFKAENVGTHFWHSHTGMQRGDGVFGAFIIRQPKQKDPHAHLYDFDLSEHTMLVQDWVHVAGVVMFSSHHHSVGDNKPMTLLMNGKGRYYKAIWQQIKAREIEIAARSFIRNNFSDKPLNETDVVVETTDLPNINAELKPTEIDDTQFDSATEGVNHEFARDVDLLYAGNEENENKLRFRQNNELSRLTRMLALQPKVGLKDKTTESNSQIQLNSSEPEVSTEPLTPANRAKRDVPFDPTVQLDQVPLHVFNVRRGFRYRFRIINAEFLNCPITVSIDNHSLTAINSDGYDFEAVEVGAIVTYAGERFDFIVNANQTPDNYWIRLKGLMDCSPQFTSAFQVAILHYEDAPMADPAGEPKYDHQAEGIELNVMNRGPGYVDSLTIAELTALPSYDSVPGIDHDALKPVADYKFFVYYDFYAKDNPVFHPADYYGFNDTLNKSNRLFTPQLNHISLQFPSVSLLSARDNVDESLFCNDTSLAAQGIDCRQEFCKCHHVLQVPLNSVVEIILVDEGFTFNANHPFHLHGNAFRVVGLERLGENVTIEMVKEIDRYNLLKRNLKRAPVKDTVTVPDGGYTIIRFEAYNPGFWLFHCHIEFHAEIGMALIFKVGDNDEMLPVPKNFPTCSDYMPKLNDNQDESKTDTTTASSIGNEQLTTIADDGNGANSLRGFNTVLVFTILSTTWLLLC